MKLIITNIAILFSILMSSANNPRITSSLNYGWKFFKGDIENASAINFDDSKWEQVNIPHTWNKEDANDETPGLYRGTGWYRWTLTLNAKDKDKELFISFDGVGQEAELFVNGQFVGKHLGGYSRFVFDITKFVKFGEQTQLAVKASNQYNKNLPPLSADYTFFGGIYRDVNLILTEKTHFTTTDFASYGVYITTPTVSEKEALVQIKTMVSNDQSSTQNLRIENSIFSPKGDILLSKSSSIKLNAGTTLALVQKDLKINSPELWSTDSPSLYKVVSKVYDVKTGQLLDEVVNPLGLRWFEFSADKGFSLNGKSMKLIGTNRHQCFLNMGNALPDEIHVRDIKLLKAMGGNFLRVSHYPQDHVVMEMCDKLGILCSVEIPVVNAITESEEFTSNCLTMAHEMVLQDFNRPSVVIWAYMNEVMLRPPFLTDSIRNAIYFKNVGALGMKIENQLNQDDPSRYTMIPCHGNLERYMDAGLTVIPKILGFNLYSGWYGGEFKGADEFLKNAKQKVPNKPFILTEYGADVDIRLHSFDPKRFDYTQEYGNLFHEYYIKMIMGLPWVAGATIWNLNDFYSEGREFAVPHFNLKGIVSSTREKKDSYLQYQAILSKTPVLNIGGSNWTIRGGVVNEAGTCLQPVKVYSNQKTVELLLNGKSLGVQNVVDNIALFEVPFVNGENRLDALTAENPALRDQLKVDFRAIPSNLKDTKTPFNEINVMLGSKRYFEDKTNAVVWIPEKEYTVGSWGTVGGKSYTKKTNRGELVTSDLDILGSNIDPVYQTARMGLEAFKMDVPEGKYTVCLYWAELQTNKEQKASVYNLGNDALKEDFVKRIFDVEINGTKVLDHFDLVCEFGEQTAGVKKFEVDVDKNEGLSIDFKKISGETMLNAIRVYRNY